MRRKALIIGENLGLIENLILNDKDLRMWKAEFFTNFNEVILKHKETIHMIFLELEDHNKEIINRLKEFRRYNNNALIVIVSSTREYAYEAFKIRSFQYIMKPLEEGSIIEVMTEGEKWISSLEVLNLDNRNFIINTKDNLYKLKYKDIYYFEKILRKIRVVHKYGVLEYYGTFKELEDQLDLSYFVQCHQSFILSKGRIYSYRNQQVNLKDLNETIPVSKAYVKRIRYVLSNN
ncbi:LytR/AlgR family response regulator transcription factor [Clostridium hydrogeniformans]|uniref:LytR/AlgR family response regulator transcription factor n=1 Tax=Clostridium hydrogeniformans TaxID=349933 RepID=UPI000485F60A|nr:LytTR family DNA-binding domain-containing protein [Clostridium hydrogeniformans]